MLKSQVHVLMEIKPQYELYLKKVLTLHKMLKIMSQNSRKSMNLKYLYMYRIYIQIRFKLI